MQPVAGRAASAKGFRNHERVCRPAQAGFVPADSKVGLRRDGDALRLAAVRSGNTPQTSREQELWELNRQIIREIEERRHYQTKLMDQLDRVLTPAPEAILSPTREAPTREAPIREAPIREAPIREKSKPKPTPTPKVQPIPKSKPAQPAKKATPSMARVAAPPAVLTPGRFPQPVVTEPEVDDPPVPEAKQPPLAGEKVMNIVMVGAECAPWSKTGGLGDVMGALPKGLARRGHRVMVISPRYSNYLDAWDTNVRKTYSVMGQQTEVGYFHKFQDGVDYIFVDHTCFHNRGADIYGGNRTDILFRCALLCKSALEAVWHVPCGGVPYGDENLAFIANDWHTALLPVYLQAHYRDYEKMTFARCVFVIHNMAHQGRGPFDEVKALEVNNAFGEQFRLYDPIGGEHMNIMKAGLINAQRLIAVSRGYAWECQTVEGGWGLHAVLQESKWKLSGIVNGIDYSEWSPQLDEFLKSDGYVNYGVGDMVEGKAKCKAALQRELGLPVNPNAPLMGFIGRLDYQKGVDLIRDAFDHIVGTGAQLVLLGSGRKDLEDALRDMEGRRKDQCRGWVGFSVKMAHRITAGCDILLMPSRFEPCGLNQLYAMAYGTVPIVHAVGGLRDTVTPFDPFSSSGTGWTFDRAEADKLKESISNAVVTYKQYPDSFRGLQRRGMEQDLSWDNAAKQYEDVLVEAKYQW